MTNLESDNNYKPFLLLPFFDVTSGYKGLCRPAGWTANGRRRRTARVRRLTEGGRWGHETVVREKRLWLDLRLVRMEANGGYNTMQAMFDNC